MNISVTVEGDKELIAKFEGLSKNLIHSPKLAQALLDSSMIVERKAKEHLEGMIYSLPEGSYKRTRGLFQKTMVSGKVEQEGGSILFTAVSSLVHYAKTVHWGFGRGRNSFPRPYLTKALQDSKEVVMKILSKAIL